MNGQRRHAACIQWNTDSATKKNEIRLFVETWMDLVSVIQSEAGQKEKNKYINAYMWNLEKALLFEKNFRHALYSSGQRRQWHPTPVLLPKKIPWTEEPGRLQSMGSLGAGHD